MVPVGMTLVFLRPALLEEVLWPAAAVCVGFEVLAVVWGVWRASRPLVAVQWTVLALAAPLMAATTLLGEWASDTAEPVSYTHLTLPTN